MWRTRGVFGIIPFETRRSVCVVEFKLKREIGRVVFYEVDEKVRSLSRPSGVSARAALVYSGHLAPIVAADGYFDALVPFRRLLGLVS